ncbi:hypothetical protein GCM10029964_077710 [Kibdelosporangium lantanae]
MITLNQAIATAMVHGPQAGLAQLAKLDEDPRIANHHRLASVRAHLHERAGNIAAAREHYTQAAQHTTSIPEQRYLADRIAHLSDQPT